MSSPRKGKHDCEDHEVCDYMHDPGGDEAVSPSAQRTKRQAVQEGQPDPNPTARKAAAKMGRTEGHGLQADRRGAWTKRGVERLEGHASVRSLFGGCIDRRQQE